MAGTQLYFAEEALPLLVDPSLLNIVKQYTYVHLMLAQQLLHCVKHYIWYVRVASESPTVQQNNLSVIRQCQFW